MGGWKCSLWGVILAALACIDGVIAGQLPLSGKDITEPTDSFRDSVEAQCVTGGELRRYPFTSALLEEFQRDDVDVWRVTDTGIDAYITPESMQDGLVAASSNYTVLPIRLPPRALAEKEELAVSHLELTRKKPYFNLTYLSHDVHLQYHSAANITHFMESLVNTFPNYASLIHIGHSSEGRELLGIKIAHPEPGVRRRKGFVILGAQHAREWIATSTSLYIAHALVVDPTEQQGDEARYSLRRLLDHFEFHIIPLPNPDGHEYTRKHDRLWYKNRQMVSSGDSRVMCKGIDMNRNWGYEWLPATDPESDPCRHWYPGTRPFESHEVNAIAAYLVHRTGGPGKVAAFLDLRSYGQTLSAPFSYSCDVYPADAEDQIEAALGAARAGSRVHGISINTGRLCETLYSAPGNVLDWAYAVARIKYSYAAHLRDTGTYGFLLPEEWIRPTGEETTALINYLATFILKDPKTME